MLESAIVNITNGAMLFQVQRNRLSRVFELSTCRNEAYVGLLLWFFLPRLFWYQISLTKRIFLERDLIGPDQVRQRISGMIGMAPGPLREFSAAYGPRTE